MDITKKDAFLPIEVLIVGDNEDSEIRARNRIEMTTVQTLRPGVEPGITAADVIENLNGLEAITASGNESLSTENDRCGGEVQSIQQGVNKDPKMSKSISAILLRQGC